jgi:hypothetical protein
MRVHSDHHIHRWVLLSSVEAVAGTPDSKDWHVPLVSHTTARPRQADTSLDSQTMIGRQLESEPAGASRRYENPRDAYDYSIRQLWRTGFHQLAPLGPE